MTDSDQTETSPMRVCRKCSTQSALSGEFCPHCGTSYVKGRRPRVSKRKVIAIAVSAVLVLALASGLVAKRQHDADVREDKAIAAAAKTKADKVRAASEAAESKEAEDEAERKVRRQLIGALEMEIVKSAKKVVKTGYFDGPILSAQCTATGGGSSDDLTALTGTFDCLAVNEEHKDGTMSGYGYNGTIDWQDGTIGWEPDR